MNIVVPHEDSMVRRFSLVGGEANPAENSWGGEQIWINEDLTAQERANIALVNRFWLAWKALPFDMDALRDCFAPNVIVRTGWRGEQVVQGREAVLEEYAEEIQRQTDHGEVTDFRFPILVAKGSVVFHTWIWIARSERLGYQIERPMAATYLITHGQIERWDSCCTGPEGEPGHVHGNGPDGL